jgi:putative ABC transport system permease protein
MLGVIIGNAAFVAMASLGESAKLHTIQRVEAFHGPNRLIAYSRVDKTNSKVTQKPKLLLGDALALEKGTPSIKAVAPIVGSSLLGRVRNTSLFIWVTGTTAAYLTVKNEAVGSGRFFTAEEVDQTARVAVLGSSIANRLYGAGDPLRQTLAIKNNPFQVIGVMKPKGTLNDKSPDDFVYIPITSFSAFLRGDNVRLGIPIDYIEISAASKEQVKDAIFQATNLLATRRGARDFDVAPNIPYQSLIGEVSSTLTLFLAVLASISMIIGGIGIMNVMLVTVSERTSEIGLRKAIGATNQSIMLNFLIESALLSVVGAAIGVSIGVGVVLVIVMVSPLPFIVPAWSVVTSLLLSSAVGIIFGVSPAIQAAKLDPIAALRSR